MNFYHGNGHDHSRGRRQRRKNNYYWVDFPASTSGAITLPAGEGDEPSTGFFAEAYILLEDVADSSDRVVISRGAGSTTDGYDLALDLTSGRVGSYRGYLDGPAGGAVTTGLGNQAKNGIDIPIHVAFGWSAAKQFIYFWLNGVKGARRTSDAVPINYANLTSGPWKIGLLGASTWPFKGKICYVRVATDFPFDPDSSQFLPMYKKPRLTPRGSNTVFQWKSVKPLLRRISDTSGHHHGGVYGTALTNHGKVNFKEHEGYTLWNQLCSLLPVPTTNIYLYRNGGSYFVYKKIQTSHWSKWVVNNGSGATKMLQNLYVGTPTPDNDDPTSWSTDPATQLMQTGISDYAQTLTPDGGISGLFGGSHGGEVEDSFNWYLDGVLTTINDTTWYNGAEIKLVQNIHWFQGAILDILQIVKTCTWNNKNQWMNYHYRFTNTVELLWQNGYPIMIDWIEGGNLDRFITGWNKASVDIATSSGNAWSPVMACYNSSNGNTVAAMVTPYDMATFNQAIIPIGSIAGITNNTISPNSKSYIGGFGSADHFYGHAGDVREYETRRIALSGVSNNPLKGK